MKSLHTLKLFFVAILLCCSNLLLAEDWYGSIGSKTYSSDATVYLTGNVSITGQITVKSGATLTIYAYNGNRQISKSFSGTGSRLFYVESGGKLRIYGNSYRVTIDCGFEYSTPYDAYTSVTSNGYTGRIIECKGNLVLNKVTLQNSYNNSSGDCLHFTNQGSTASLQTVELTDVIIRGCKARGGPAVYFVGDDYHNATFTNVEIYGCYATCLENDFGCIIRQNGGARVNLTLDACHIHDNHSDNAGGAIGWNAAGLADNKLIIKGDTEIDHNVATEIGGGLNIEARAEIQSANIHHNTAGRGGGIFMKTYDGTQESFSGDGFNLTVSTGVKIYDNIATVYGGGVAMEICKSDDIGFNPAGEAISPEFKFAVAGGEIYNNQAPKGAGAAFLDKAPKKHYNGSIWSGEYVRNVVISSGSIHDNKCDVLSSDTQGAGIYIRKFKDDNISDETYIDAGGAGTITITASGGNVYNNKSRNNYSNGIGGGIYINNEIPESPYNSVCEVKISGASFYSNESDSHGAGIYLTNGSVSMTSGNIGKTDEPNKTYNGNGAGLYIDGGDFTMGGGNVCGNLATGDGGGLYVNDGDCTLNNGYIHDNDATNNGGGVYMNGGNFIHNSGEIGKNYANPNTAVNGAGVFMNGGIYKMKGGYNNANAASGNGGGVYMAGGRFELLGGSIGYGSGDYKNTATNGAGIYMAGNGEFMMTDGYLRGNFASSNGGGIYMEGGTCTVTAGNIGTSSSYNNTAVKGGGIYSEGGEVSFSNGNMKYNSATYGGGIYADGGTVTFSSGTIENNSATEAGGGIYVDEDGVMYLQGSSTLSKNHVPSGKHGGGIYLLGVITVGDEPTKDLGTITAIDNYAGSSYQYSATANNRNNIYLVNPTAVPYTSTEPHKGVITLIENGINTTSSRVGFSVPRNFVPVIYCDYSSTSHAYLAKFSTGGAYANVVFDDSESYKAVNNTYNPFFDPDHVYLYGFWVNIVTTEPEGFSIDAIDSDEDLAWLISLVDGYNGQTANTYENDSIVLTADINISRYGWVPVGTSTHPFKGTFIGNGHSIKGISTLFYDTDITDYGLFGVIEDGSVQDVFITDASYSLSNVSGLVIGGLAAKLNGQASVANSEVHANIAVLNSSAIMGGLVGRMERSGDKKPAIHSCIAVGEMSGYLMGGLIGNNIGGEVKNSFSNVKFDYKGTSSYVGGLAAQSTGAFENCYTHELAGSNHGSNYGSLVGDNTDGSVNYCYAASMPYTISGKEGSLNGHSTYADNTQVPYLYKRRDNQISEPNKYLPTESGVDKQMLIALNRWVDTMNIKHAGNFTYWIRPTTKDINDDLPLLLMPSVDAVAGTLSSPRLAYGPVNNCLAEYANNSDASILLYRNNGSVNSNADAQAELYIAENVALVQNDTLKAHVGITLDNSAGANGAYPDYFDVEDVMDWHMFSTPLIDAPLGIDYSDSGSHEFSMGHPDGMPYYRFYPETDPKHGYFPSHTYDCDYPTSDATLVGNPGNYYGEWDFYCYYEPSTHWINFKRNSNSHWNLYEGHDNIEYVNEAKLVQGKGYLLSTLDPTFLQTYGTLNQSYVKIPLTYSDVPNRKGYNLLGNPYQAYLDFDAFAGQNADLWGGKEQASYTILDEDAAQYVTYAYGSSENPFIGGRYIHPHQGFFIQVAASDTARFTPAMRNVDAEGVNFRSERPAYPLVNLFATEEDGHSDMVTVELGRPDMGGALLMHELRLGNGRIWCSYEDQDYTIAFTQPGISEAAIRFETAASAIYTMTWNTQNGEFEYLHLIDNITGSDIDCLAASEYRFTSKPWDYKSRFKLVFGYTGVEENEEDDTSSTGSEDFAFVMGDELVVNGEGILQLFDMNGRQIVSQSLSGPQTSLGLPNMASSVYMLRLTQGGTTKVQKIVINK
jgi:hypothetical protein